MIPRVVLVVLNIKLFTHSSAIVHWVHYNTSNLNSTIIIPGNMYGEFDNFRNDESHVIPALIRKFFEAKKNNDNVVILWGDGSPIRDFIYAKDVAEILLNFIDNDVEGPINISSGINKL